MSAKAKSTALASLGTVAAVRVTPPKPASSTPARISAAVMPKPVDATSPRLSHADFDNSDVDIQDKEWVDFSLAATKGAASIHLIPCGWPAGGCPPEFVILAGNLGLDTITAFGLPYKGTPTEACRIANCRFDSKGILTIKVTGAETVIDTNNYYTDGYYLTVSTDGTGANGVAGIFSTEKLPAFIF